MNLRDQFLKAGLVNKKHADQVAREKKKEDRVAQGHAIDKATQQRQEAEAREAERKAREEETIRKRREADAREAATRTTIASRQILRAKALPLRKGKQLFWFKSPDGREAWRLELNEYVATDLRCGRVALAWVDDQHPEVVLIDPLTANRIEELRPELVLFRNKGPIDTDPSQQLWEPMG